MTKLDTPQLVREDTYVYGPSSAETEENMYTLKDEDFPPLPPSAIHINAQSEKKPKEELLPLAIRIQITGVHKDNLFTWKSGVRLLAAWRECQRGVGFDKLASETHTPWRSVAVRYIMTIVLNNGERKKLYINTDKYNAVTKLENSCIDFMDGLMWERF